MKQYADFGQYIWIGTFASLIQSFIGNVVAGSSFAIFQSIGALAILTKVGVGIAVGVPAVVFGWEWVKTAWMDAASWLKRKKRFDE